MKNFIYHNSKELIERNLFFNDFLNASRGPLAIKSYS